MIRWILARSTICLPTNKEPTNKDNIKRTIDNSIKVKDFLNLRDDEVLKLLSLSLSLSLREYRSINKKFHKTSKIKNIRIMFEKSYLSRGGARPQAVACEWQDRRQRPRMPKAPHVQWCKVLFMRRGFGDRPSFF